MSARSFGAALTLAALGACTAPRPAAKETYAGGARVVLEEQARDGAFGVPASTRTPVDANADLVISFTPVGVQEGVIPVGTDAEFQAFLDKVTAMGKLRQETLVQTAAVARLPVDSRKAARDELVQKTKSLDEENQKLIATLKGLGLTSREITAILFDPKAPPEEDRAFARLVEWLTRHEDRIRESVTSTVEGKSALEVTVQAFLDSVGKSRKQLHVDNYDTLPSGEYQPVKRTSLDLTPAERERLVSDLQQYEAIAKTLRDLKAQGGDAKKAVLSAFASVRDKWKELIGSLVADPEAAMLATLETTPPLAEADKKRLTTEIQAVAAPIRLAIDAGDAWTRLLAKPASLPDLLLLVGRIQEAAAKSKAALEALATLPEKVATLGKDKSLPEPLKALVAQSIQTFLDRLAKESPELDSLLEDVIAPIVRRVLDDPDPKPPDDSKALWHLLKDAPEGRVKLTRAGLVPGDEIIVKAIFRKSAKEEPVATVTYKTETELLGWHREVSAELIFVRADHGSDRATDWAMNVAAVADLHYTIRDPSTLGAIWNFLDPAPGVHLASLDQTDEGVEFGLGGNLSLFGGFLTAGIGANLSASQDELYYFVGIDLFDVLSSAKKSMGGAP